MTTIDQLQAKRVKIKEQIKEKQTELRKVSNKISFMQWQERQ